MKISRTAVRRLAAARGLAVSEVLRRAGVSANAFYTLARRPAVVPRSVRAVARALGVSTAAVLEADGPPDRAADLVREARRIHARHPSASFDHIWHTLWLLEEAPAERLERSLTRGHAASRHR